MFVHLDTICHLINRIDLVVEKLPHQFDNPAEIFCVCHGDSCIRDTSGIDAPWRKLLYHYCYGSYLAHAAFLPFFLRGFERRIEHV